MLDPRRRTPMREWSRRQIATRVFAALSAFGLVSAFALAALLPPDLKLGAVLLMFDPRSLMSLHDVLVRHAPDWLWKQVAMPFLLRPSWMLPLMLAIVAGGIAFSVDRAGPTRQSTRRNS